MRKKEGWHLHVFDIGDEVGLGLKSSGELLGPQLHEGALILGHKIYLFTNCSRQFKYCKLVAD